MFGLLKTNSAESFDSTKSISVPEIRIEKYKNNYIGSKLEFSFKKMQIVIHIIRVYSVLSRLRNKVLKVIAFFNLKLSQHNIPRSESCAFLSMYIRTPSCKTSSSSLSENIENVKIIIFTNCSLVCFVPFPLA